ncbi:MAG: GntR family transcriptional regulator [Firmicutes bacterium]|nr:GntR family transcriptional regulator [Bacillota bacterium]
MQEIVQSDSFVQQVYEIIRRQIVTMNLRPGEKLGVEQLASSLGVSRTPVREALNLLVREGLVTVKPRVGYYVVRLTPTDVEEICDVRKMIELYSLEHALKTVPAAKWQELLTASRVFLTDPQATEKRSDFFDLDRDLHGTILSGVNNRRLHEVAYQIWAFVDLMFNMNQRILEATKEHIGILEAILESDLSAAKKRLALHIDDVCQAIIRNL